VRGRAGGTRAHANDIIRARVQAHVPPHSLPLPPLPTVNMPMKANGR